MIRIENVSRSYSKGKDRVEAVKDLTLKVEQGELFGFLGPNGAGKTTTIKMLAGLLKSDKGNIFINDIDVQKNSLAAKAIIGYVPEEPVLYEKMSGIKFLLFIADVYNVEKSKRDIIYDLAEVFGIKGALFDPISSYSHGMRQKVSLISAMLHTPLVLIFDEPTSGLDPKAAFNLKERLKKYCEQGKTVFFSTHVLEVAERLCDRVGIINNGKLIISAPFAELKTTKGKNNATLEQIFLELTGEDS